MLPFSPSVQIQTEELQSETGTPPVAEPTLSGPAPALWAGFAAFVVIMVVVLLLIIRGRVIRPAARKTAAPEDFFEPAGETAEITFDDEEHAKQPELTSNEIYHESTSKAEIKVRRSPFANLFAKKPKTQPEEVSEYDMLAGDAELEAFEPEPTPSNENHQAPQQETVLGRTAGPKQLVTMNDDVEARRREAEDHELQRLEAKEEAEEQARRQDRTAAAAALAAFPRAERSSPDAGLLYEKMQETVDTALTERFDALSHDIHQRLDTLTEQIDNKIPTAQELAGLDAHGVSEAHFSELANLIGEQLETLRDASTTSIEALSRRLDKLDANPEGAIALSKHIAKLNQTFGGKAAASTAGRIQLTDILASALPPGRYALGRKLSSNKTVDALVDIAGAAAPIAIDARFPVEAFDEYERTRLEAGKADSAETEFRRLMLRHIVGIAEKQIAPDETADCALMFVPSEHILTTLYASFSDIVQESYRARIWMVSPASLTASLYTISALISAPANIEDEQPAGHVAPEPLDDEHIEAEKTDEAEATNASPIFVTPHTDNQELPDAPEPSQEPPASADAPHFPLR